MSGNRALARIGRLTLFSPWPLIAVFLAATILYSSLALRVVEPVGEAVLVNIEGSRETRSPLFAKLGARP